MIETLLAQAPEAIEVEWKAVQQRLAQRFGREPGIEAALYLIGLRERGTFPSQRLKKEDKQAFIMEGTHRVFEAVGIYARNAHGEWERIAPLPVLGADEQERLLKAALIRYFEDAWASE